jgi:hypothetical protein
MPFAITLRLDPATSRPLFLLQPQPNQHEMPDGGRSGHRRVLLGHPLGQGRRLGIAQGGGDVVVAGIVGSIACHPPTVFHPARMFQTYPRRLECRMAGRAMVLWKPDFDNMNEVVMPAAIRTPKATPTNQSCVVRD